MITYSTNLQTAIAELCEFPVRPEAAWVAKVNTAPNEVIIGAILSWAGQTGVSLGPDAHASRREAADTILRARLSGQMLDATTRLHEIVDAYQHQSARQTTWMIGLTWAISVLTAIMVGAIIVQIIITARSG